MKTNDQPIEPFSAYYVRSKKDELKWNWNFSKKRITSKFIVLNTLVVASPFIFIYLQ